MLRLLKEHPVWACLLGLCVAFAAMFPIIQILNGDLYGRLVDVQSAKGVFDPAADDPTITVVLHHLIADQNAIDASFILEMNIEKFDDFKKKGNRSICATVFDASVQPYGIGQTITIDFMSAEAAPAPGVGIVSRESPHFELPVNPSMSGFPFDDVGVRFITEIQGTQAFSYAHFIKVEKQIPGRILSTGVDGGIPVATLSRTVIERFLTLASGLVFFTLVMWIAFRLFVSPPLGEVASMMTFAGFLIGTAGFRNSLGLSRATGGSAFEVFTFEIPFIVLATALLRSSLRGHLASQRQDDVALSE